MYTLMRYYFKENKTVFMLDLYDHKNEKGVELQYYVHNKIIDKLLMDTLHNLTFKTLDINTWDDIIHQFITNI